MGRTTSRALAKSAERAGGTGNPALRRRWFRAALRAGRSRTTVSTPKSLTAAHELLEACRADHLLVLRVLQHRAERALDSHGVQGLHAEHAQSRQPVDRLRHARRLLNVAVAHP